MILCHTWMQFATIRKKKSDANVTNMVSNCMPRKGRNLGGQRSAEPWYVWVPVGRGEYHGKQRANGTRCGDYRLTTRGPRSRQDIHNFQCGEGGGLAHALNAYALTIKPQNPTPNPKPTHHAPNPTLWAFSTSGLWFSGSGRLWQLEDDLLRGSCAICLFNTPKFRLVCQSHAFDSPTSHTRQKAQPIFFSRLLCLGQIEPWPGSEP